jgi:hypothetical protein
MSQLLITQYLNELDRLRKISGTKRETVVREAFKDLLKGWGKTRELQFIAELPDRHGGEKPDLSRWRAAPLLACAVRLLGGQGRRGRSRHGNRQEIQEGLSARQHHF